jgi:basic amino acid/polyamine antiporter, APA family
MTSGATEGERLRKQLGLFDVYAICTGAMFASGFFLLPGIAAANAGPAVVLAYLISALLMIPAMLSIAELSSAMPRAAGTYFFIHRSMGPLAGTVGGFGAWLVLVFKSAFALVGMGAYLALLVDVPMRPIAIALTVAFGVLNVIGAKETARLQIWLVVTLVAIMTFFIAQGAIHLIGTGRDVGGQFTPFLPFGTEGLVATIGLVFISYAGLTKVSSAAEEIRDLDRNLPLGMALSLLTVGAIYTLGVLILVAVLDPGGLRDDLTPVATAGELLFAWLPGPTGLAIVVIAAITAFASTGNAGILTASRYPLAMARDRLLWGGFDRLGRFGTPTLGIVVTCVVMVAAILFLDVERLATLGSAFLLLLFVLINLSVILMRESRMSSYAPGYRSPLYPWVQIVGVVSMVGLLATLGVFYVGFVLVIIALAALWFRWYVRERVPRRAAIYGLFLRLGELHDQGVDEELWAILQERGASESDSFDQLVTRATILELDGTPDLRTVVDRVTGALTQVLDPVPGDLGSRLEQACERGVVPTAAPAVVYDLAMTEIDRVELVLVRVPRGVVIGGQRRFPGDEEIAAHEPTTVQALIFHIGVEQRMTEHLRVLAQLASMVEQPEFPREWRRARSDQELKETLLRDERFVSIVVGDAGPPAQMVDRRLREIEFPGDTLVALIRRGSRSIVPHGETMLREGDRLTIVGSPGDVSRLMPNDRSRGPSDAGS